MNHLPPGSTIGIFGGGQLGRMLAIAAKAMGYRTVSLDPAQDCPASQVCDDHIAASYDDLEAAEELARKSDVVTYEFENVDAAAVERIDETTEVIPSPSVLRLTQDRELEKGAIRDLGIAVPEYRIVTNRSDAVSAAREIGVPVVLKTVRWGYDGKGQGVARTPDAASELYGELIGDGRGSKVIVERMIDFEMEISVICGRDRGGEMCTFPVPENIHADGILDLSIAGDRTTKRTANEAERVAQAIAEGFGVVGLIAVEMFVTRDGDVLVNETAPRPHNSGHYTIEGCATSQFEQLARIAAGLPMGDTTLLTPCAMANLLGDVWIEAGGAPNWGAALEVAGSHLHLYGKSEARRGRKMGHITVTAAESSEALELARESRRLLLT